MIEEKTRFKGIILLATALFLSFSGNGCVNNAGGGGSGKCKLPSCPSQEGNDVQRITRPCNAAVNGILSESGKSYFREDSNIAQPGNCVFVRFDDLEKRCSLKVCANVTPPSGWIEYAPYHDKEGCDRPSSPSLFNVKQVQRCYDISVTPQEPVLGDMSIGLPNGTLGIEYSQSLSATNNAPDGCPISKFLFVLSSGKMPDGVSISEEGRFYGKPSKSGTFKFQIRVSDSETGCSLIRSYTIEVV